MRKKHPPKVDPQWPALIKVLVLYASKTREYRKLQTDPSEFFRRNHGLSDMPRPVNDISDPTGQNVVTADKRPVDMVGSWVAELFETAEQVRVHLERLGHLTNCIDHRGDRRRNAEAAGAGECQACEEFMPGTASHRLRAGLCPACYESLRYWRSNIAADPTARMQFLEWRRAHIESTDEEAVVA